MPTPLTTTRTHIRRLTLGDLDALRELESDALVMAPTGYRRVQSLEETQGRLERTVAEAQETEPYGIWGAWERQGAGAMVAWVMLVEREAMSPELGFMIPRRAWGQGFATEVAGRIVAHAFEDLELDVLSAMTDTDNAASQRVLRKLGFEKVPDPDEEPGRRIFRLDRGEGSPPLLSREV